MIQYKNIVILTGAGISAESGLKTFRDNNGLWEDHAVEEVATPEAFARNPILVHRFYNQRRLQLNSGDVSPNTAHLEITRLQNNSLCNVDIITQNVDNLHEQAGNRNVLHMHGELNKVKCVISGKVYEEKGELSIENICACCNKVGTLRPDIVWFGEMPYHLDKIESLLSSCDLFISIGTSGQVYPAAGLVEIAKLHGAQTIEINLTDTEISKNFNISMQGKASKIVKDVVEFLLAGKKY